MSKAKFEYDQNGATFYYFVGAFLTLTFVPLTYYLWPADKSVQEDSDNACKCSGCQTKRQQIKNQHKYKRSIHRIVRVFLLIGWAICFVVYYKCLTVKLEYVNWNPYEILGIDDNATVEVIKKAYRQLSLTYHPDKYDGDSNKFVQISKAYNTLTDESSRKNWEEYGHPEGPRAASFGIALPSWIVEKENSFVVLGIYGLIFMIALPISVGTWWYKSIKYGNDKVLINTSEVFYFFIHKTPHMALKRIIMILSASLEFSKTHNSEVIERPSDNIEVPRLMRDLVNLGENNKEKPICFSYSVKARAILHAHLSRMDLPPNTLELDRQMIVKKCPHLMHEFVNCVAQLITLALSGRVANKPTLATLENSMKLTALIIQGLWEYRSPILQLPYLKSDHIRVLEKNNIKSIEELAKLDEEKRRNLLKHLNDQQYEDLSRVMFAMPVMKTIFKFEVLDDEEPEIISAGSIVTVTVNLERTTLGDDKIRSTNVHCPYFPDTKEECWWIYLADRKRMSLVTAPLLVKKFNEPIELKFTAPQKPQTYTYQLVARCDSYVDCVSLKSGQITVKPAKDYLQEAEKMWDLSEDEDVEYEENSAVEDSDLDSE